MKKIRFSKTNIKNERGNVLALSYMLITVLLLVGAAYMVMSGVEKQVSERQKRSLQALYVAEAGIDRALYDLTEDFDADGSWVDGAINGISVTPDSSSFTTLPYGSTSLNGGTYTVSLKTVTSSARHMYVRSTGTIGDVSRTIEAYIRMRALSPWDNAIFAGSGAAGASINGNASVHGSVHILGDALTSSDLAMDMSGSGKVYNNYTDLPADLEVKIPDLPTTVYNGEVVSTLNAELRVKTGQVSLGGTSAIGETNVNGDSDKETLDGVYVSDGYAGSGGSGSVYSDNGTSNTYDLGNTLSFPSLSTAYGGYGSYTAYIEANAYDATGCVPTLDPNSSFTCSGANGSISMDGNGNLAIDGIVYIDGNLSMQVAGAEKTINYTGTGTILATGDVNVDVNLLSSGDNSYPDNIIGIMTPNTITFNQASIDVMGLFYAENTITIMKQTNIIGSIVSNYFDMGSNVPSIYYVPEIVDNLPPGLITVTPTWYLTLVSWQEI